MRRESPALLRLSGLRGRYARRRRHWRRRWLLNDLRVALREKGGDIADELEGAVVGSLGAAHVLHTGVRREVEASPKNVLSDVDVIVLRNVGDRNCVAPLLRGSTSGLVLNVGPGGLEIGICLNPLVHHDTDALLVTEGGLDVDSTEHTFAAVGAKLAVEPHRLVILNIDINCTTYVSHIPLRWTSQILTGLFTVLARQELGVEGTSSRTLVAHGQGRAHGGGVLVFACPDKADGIADSRIDREWQVARDTINWGNHDSVSGLGIWILRLLWRWGPRLFFGATVLGHALCSTVSDSFSGNTEDLLTLNAVIVGWAPRVRARAVAGCGLRGLGNRGH